MLPSPYAESQGDALWRKLDGDNRNTAQVIARAPMRCDRHKLEFGAIQMAQSYYSRGRRSF